MRQPIVKDLRSKTKANHLTSKAKAKDFIKCPRGQGHGLEDFITARSSLELSWSKKFIEARRSLEPSWNMKFIEAWRSLKLSK